jgi:hypothetical protein
MKAVFHCLESTLLLLRAGDWPDISKKKKICDQNHIAIKTRFGRLYLGNVIQSTSWMSEYYIRGAETGALFPFAGAATPKKHVQWDANIK